MGLIFRKRIRIGANETVNLSKRVGQVTDNSRSRGSIRILPGLSVRLGRRWCVACVSSEPTKWVDHCAEA